MKKSILVATAAVAVVSLLAACTPAGDSAEESTLVVYTPNSEAILDIIIPAFEAETGIKVEVLNAGAGELLTRVQSERNAPYADVLLGAVRGDFEEYFEEYVSPDDASLYENSRNTSGLATAYMSNGSVLLVNDQVIGDVEVTSYEDLLNPALKGRIAAADPSTSSSAFAQLTNILVAKGGDYESDAGWNYLAELIQNLDGKIAAGSSQVHKSVADGEYAVGLTYEEPSAGYVRDGAPVRVVYPTEGAVFLDSYVGIVKGAPHRSAAEKFVDFVISDQVQSRLGTELTSRPLRADADLGAHLVALDSIALLQEDNAYVAEHKSELLARYGDLFASLQ